jgi:DNA-binding IclR family transcriptional regulator
MQSMVAMAVPVLDVNERLMVTLSFHAPSQRFDVDRMLGCLQPLRDAAADLSKLVRDSDKVPYEDAVPKRHTLPPG